MSWMPATEQAGPVAQGTQLATSPTGAAVNVAATTGGQLEVATGLSPVPVFSGGVSALNTQSGALDNGTSRSNHTLVVTTSAGVSAGAVALQGSNDGVNWFTTSATVTTIAANTTYAAALIGWPWRYIRACVTTGITGGTVTATLASAG